MALTDEALEQAKAILGEQFQNYAIVVQHDDEEVEYDSNNQLMGKALFQEALEQMKEQRELENQDVEVIWEDEDEDPPYDRDWETIA